MQPQIPTFVPNFPAADIQTILAVIITLIFLWWAIFSAVAIYHWIRFERDSMVAVPAIAVYIFVSAWIFVFSTGALR